VWLFNQQKKEGGGSLRRYKSAPILLRRDLGILLLAFCLDRCVKEGIQRQRGGGGPSFSNHSGEEGKERKGAEKRSWLLFLRPAQEIQWKSRDSPL